MNESLNNPFTPESEKPKRSLVELFGRKNEKVGTSDIDKAMIEASAVVKSNANERLLERQRIEGLFELESDLSEDDYMCIKSLIKIGLDDEQIKGALSFKDDILSSIFINFQVPVEKLYIPSTLKYLSLTEMTSHEGLNIPEGVYGIQFNSLKSAEGLKIPNSIKRANLAALDSVKGLVLPEGIEEISLNSLTSADGLHFPETLTEMSLMGLTSEKGLILPQEVNSLKLSKLTSVENLIFPKKISGGLYLESLVDARGVKFPDKVYGLMLNSITSAEGVEFPRDVHDLELDSLESLEGLNLPVGFSRFSAPNVKNIPEGYVFPESLKTLNLNGLLTVDNLVCPPNLFDVNLMSLTSAKGLRLPEGLTLVILRGLTSYEGLVLPDSIQQLDLSALSEQEIQKLIDRYPKHERIIKKGVKNISVKELIGTK